MEPTVRLAASGSLALTRSLQPSLDLRISCLYILLIHMKSRSEIVADEEPCSNFNGLWYERLLKYTQSEKYDICYLAHYHVYYDQKGEFLYLDDANEPIHWNVQRVIRSIIGRNEKGVLYFFILTECKDCVSSVKIVFDDVR
jgi:hypothetical protein